MRYSKWQRKLNRFAQLLILVFVLALGILVSVNDKNLTDYFIFILFSILVVTAFVSAIVQRRINNESLSPDKLVTYFVYATTDNLDRYFDPKRADTPKRQGKFRKVAIENSNQLLSVVEGNWKVGNFGLAKKVLGTAVSDFKGLLSKRLIPVIREGGAEALNKANNILWQFSVFMKNPTTEQLTHLNKRIVDENLPEIPVQKRDYRLRISGFLKAHMLVIHVLSILGILGSTFLIYFIGVDYLGLPKDGAFNTSITYLGVLFAAYLVIVFTLWSSGRAVKKEK